MTGAADDGFDAYKTLQVDPEADPEVIQAAYRRLAQKWHPDVAPGAEAAARMVAINRAWELLADPTTRAAYDRYRAAEARARERQPASGGDGRSASSASGHPGGAAPAGAGGTARGSTPGAGRPPAADRQPESVSRDWTSGRSTTGYSYDEPSMRTADGTGAAGPPPGNPSGSVLNFGRYAGWSLGELGRHDLEYIEWLDRMPIGRPYRDEIDGILRRSGRRRSAPAEATDRRGLFRRR
ncbi:MAG: J domain-containing protein [Candidatus Limnocylindrales bacterium]